MNSFSYEEHGIQNVILKTMNIEWILMDSWTQTLSCDDKYLEGLFQTLIRTGISLFPFTH